MGPKSPGLRYGKLAREIRCTASDEVPVIDNAWTISRKVYDGFGSWTACVRRSVISAPVSASPVFLNEVSIRISVENGTCQTPHSNLGFSGVVQRE